MAEAGAGDAMATLLAVHADQASTYVTLVWQVPAVSLTAQAFLFTVLLDPKSPRLARLITAGLSTAISLMSSILMHNHRKHAVVHAEIAAQLARRLGYGDALPGVPDPAEALTRISEGNYRLWLAGLALFGATALAAFFGSLFHPSWF